MKTQWTVVDALRHSRHDWLNRLQLIKAHLSLGNEARVQELIHEFVGEAQQESRLMNVKMPLFTELLLTYTWSHPPCNLEYEVLGDVHTLTKYDEVMYTWTLHFFSMLHQVVDVHAENHLCITIEQDDRFARFFFDFRGKLENIDEIKNWVIHRSNNIVSSHIAPEEISIEIQLTKEG
ncbi:Spo0B C-terminal domain-containing protein [Ectobacillus antri]|jgi:stage 0 sporulation protein B (sporulation initiation phosphotransferase)|uniref:Spo0B C-terminal domain-containing protein n=1 Tax=Ectobacillus antri TaxID=2486280 RepID=A0ABT6H161_9BACI|nr:Spo0B C-terminal domain-containing protein [Ectobacillus antri]MDG4655378.1 Spo0B C-terminal domain-containing protein [Ectobacillus antri]MDG5753136.1 Spo0B C-terminal domain-containing protein [Ectobacillus antri]